MKKVLGLFGRARCSPLHTCRCHRKLASVWFACKRWRRQASPVHFRVKVVAAIFFVSSAGAAATSPQLVWQALAGTKQQPLYYTYGGETREEWP